MNFGRAVSPPAHGAEEGGFLCPHPRLGRRVAEGGVTCSCVASPSADYQPDRGDGGHRGEMAPGDSRPRQNPSPQFEETRTIPIR